MLDAYRRIDDEGESLDDAFSAIDYYLASIVRPHPYVMVDGLISWRSPSWSS